MDKINQRAIKGWTFYDWANSVYVLVVTTAIFPLFYEANVDEKVNLFGFEFINTELLSYAGALTYLIVSLISPILSGVADYSNHKRLFMKAFCYIGSVSCVLLYFFSAENLGIGLGVYVLAGIGYWGSVVFYNAYLPEIAPPYMHDKISAKGYSSGYIGSSILLIVCLAIVMGLGGKYTPYCFILVGLWWASFSQITFARLPHNKNSFRWEKGLIWKGYKELLNVYKEIKSQKRLKRFLVAFFVYSMAVQTIMFMATSFGIKEIAWASDDAKSSGLIISILIIQFIAIAGAYYLANLSKRKGNIYALIWVTCIWTVICLIGLTITLPWHFYIMAASVGFVMGGIQSLSRSTYSKFLPETKDHASYFSFFDVAEKIGMVLGLIAYGALEGYTGSMRYSVAFMAVFFIVGLILLNRVPRNK